jgi:hypothetical protein
MQPAWPLSPLQAFCLSGLRLGVCDVRWTDPAELPGNSRFTILGVNVYRSFGSEYGPYYRVNAVPVGAMFWRDAAASKVVLQEDVSSSFLLNPGGEYFFRTMHSPVVVDPVPGGTNCVSMNVQVTVGGQPAAVDWMDPANGIIRLSASGTWDVINQHLSRAAVDAAFGGQAGSSTALPAGTVLASYRYLDNQLPVLDKRIFYKVTTVASDADGSLLETPLEEAAGCNAYEIEKLNYIWREAIRRNHWMLEHGGERVKAFIRKNAGFSCGCGSDMHGQAKSDCTVCFGTGFIGGYDGPYDIMLAPDDAEMGYKQDMRGRSMVKQYETWTGPSPLLSQRDFVLKLNGDRYGIGPVRMPSNRGMQLQQFFVVSHLDSADVRYKVPALDPATFAYPQTRYMVSGRGDVVPMITDSRVHAERSNTPAGKNES